MHLYKHPDDLKTNIESKALSGKTIGFVPTMGALHEGHLSLLKASRQTCDITVCSIFVNPTQFNNQEDFIKYPKTLSNDILLLEENDCDILFLPGEAEIYPNESSRLKHFDLGYLETILEGKFRPGHFQGVCLIVEKLLKIVQPDFLFLGQKDFQQCMVIRKLLEIMQSETKLTICPIIREKSGLAKSSRNLRLTNTEQKLAAGLHEALVTIKNQLVPNNFLSLKKEAIVQLENLDFKVEYLELATSNNLELISEYQAGQQIVVLVAAYFHEVRLIDNFLINS
ncbi:MAG TPA: pantoate--beta-alanine ligase [Hanamia sp.]